MSSLLYPADDGKEQGKAPRTVGSPAPASRAEVQPAVKPRKKFSQMTADEYMAYMDSNGL